MSFNLKSRFFPLCFLLAGIFCTAIGQTTDDLVFIHHSCGENWLSNSLHSALVAKDYIDERNDIYYGTTMSSDAGRPASLGGTPGDNTDMDHWILWFNDYLQHVRVYGCASGYNRIIMFKSCYPNSDIGSDGAEPGNPFSGTQSLVNYKSVYRHPGGAGNTYSYNSYAYQPLEDIFAENPDILFIPVTAPPLCNGCTDNDNGHRARLFNNWLKNDWLNGYNAAHPGLNNVAVYDWFNFLANADDHATYPNRLKTAYGGSGGDSHPNDTGNAASTVDFATKSGNFIDAAWQAFIANSVQLQVKLFLEGPYIVPAGNMSTALQAGNHVPTTAPYAEDARTIAAIPAAITDWVLVQLRATATGAVTASKSVLLRSDGCLVNDANTAAIFAMPADAGDYYICVQHRNHLPVMSAAAQTLSKTLSTLYDFSAASGNYYQANMARLLTPGVYGLWAGDVNQDGVVTTADYVPCYNAVRNGDSGYQSTDLNLDGSVNVTDYAQWFSNAEQGAFSHLP